MHVETVTANRSIGGIERFAVHSDPRPVPGRKRVGAPLLRMGFCVSAVVLAVLAGAHGLSRGASARGAEPAAATLPSSSPIAVPVTAKPRPVWIEINRPIQLFDLAGSGFGKLPLTYRARRRPDGVERQDFLAYGGFGTGEPYLSLSILRAADTTPAAAGLFVEMARLAAEQDLGVLGSALPSVLATSFGDFATTDLTLARGGKTRSCLGFSLQPQTEPGPVRIAGFACGTEAKPMDRKTLACLLDRVDLVSAGEDDALQGVFVDAERRRGEGCRGSRLIAGGGHDTWLDGEAVAPVLRSSGARPHTR